MTELLSEENRDEFAGMGTEQLRGVVERLANQNEYLEESMADLALRIDDMGWRPLPGLHGEDELPLDTLKKMAEDCEALVTVNPQVKRGIAARTSYIWGQGVRIGSTGDRWYSKSVRRTFGTTQAQQEVERTAASTGNLLFLVDRRTRRVQRIPFKQVAGRVSAVDDNEQIKYVKRSYIENATDLASGQRTSTASSPKLVWYPTDQLDDNDQVPVKIQDVPVERDKVIVHIPFNRMTGWAWGVPDVFAVVFWARAYKEFLENCATLSRAYARFAGKVVSSSKKGQQRTASKMAEAPTRDPATGQYSDVGNTLAMGAGNDFQFLQTIRPVEFDAGSPLAAMVAAGLEVPLPVLTSDPGSGNRATAETLDDPTVLAMRARQQAYNDGIQRIVELLGGDVPEIEWPPLADEPQHRKIQAQDQAGRTGMLYPREWRAGLLKALNMDTEDAPEEPPGENEIPLTVKQAAGLMDPAGQDPAQPDPPSRGDHELRNEGGQAHTEET